MARPVSPDWTDPEIIGRSALAHSSDLTHTPNSVHVHIATGDLGEIRRLLISHFPACETLTFQRKGGRLRRVSAHQLKRLTHGIQPAKASQARS